MESRNLFLLALGAIAISGCTKNESYSSIPDGGSSALITNNGSGDSSSSGSSSSDNGAHCDGHCKPVCDPFSPGKEGTPHSVVADLYYILEADQYGKNPETQLRPSPHVRQFPAYDPYQDTTRYPTSDKLPSYLYTDEYFNDLGKPYYGVKFEAPVFFTDINAPTQLFDSPFLMMDGKTVKYPESGNGISEYFSLVYRSQIHLSDSDDEGDYQFASLSDDGVVFKLNVNGTWKTLVDEDGIHGTELGCAYETVHFTKSSLYKMQQNYFQGPKNSIANVLLWRKIPSGGSLSEPLCDYDYPFDDYDNSWFNAHTQAAGKKYVELTARGWQPLKPANYTLPDDVTEDPCK